MAQTYLSKLICTVALLAGMYSTLYGQDNGSLLKLTIRPGETFRMSMTLDSNTSTGMLGLTFKIDHTVTMDHEFSVKSVDRNRIATVNASYTRIKVKILTDGLQGGPNNIEYDTAGGYYTNHKIAQLLDAIIGKPYTMKIASSGRIVEIKGLKEIINSALAKLDPQQASLYQSYFSDRTFQELMEFMFYIYPENLINTGDTWSRESTISQGFSAQMYTEYTLQSRNAASSRISVKGTIHSTPESSLTGIAGMTLSVSMDGAHTGFYIVDNATGWVKNGMITQNIEGETSVADAGPVAGMFDFPMTIHTKITVTSQ